MHALSVYTAIIFTKFTCTEVIVSNFIAMHNNLSFECADQLSTLFGVMFPDLPHSF